MGKLAFVYPGQGSQSVGMGKALAEKFPEARAVFDEADAALGEKLSTLCFEGPEDAQKLTRNTQPAILATSVAAHAVFAKRAPKPDYVAGHSLGEYSALTAMGALSVGDAVKSVRARGTFMQEAVPEGQGAMAAILGLEPAQVRLACEAAMQGQVVSPANYNSPEQTVIAGHAGAVERAMAKCKELGAKRALPLPVSAPFHCALMAPVQPRLREVLTTLSWKAPTSPLVSNVEARPNSDPQLALNLLIDQVVAPVRWIECVQMMADDGVTRIVEVGPGKVLGGLVKRINKTIELFNVEDEASLTKTLAALGA